MRYLSKFSTLLLLSAVLTLSGCNQVNSDLEAENQQLAEELQELRDKVDALGETQTPDETVVKEPDFTLNDFLDIFEGSWSYDSGTSFSTWIFHSNGEAEYNGGLRNSEGFAYSGRIQSVSQNNGSLSVVLTMTGGIYDTKTEDWQVTITYDGSHSPSSFTAQNITRGSDAVRYDQGELNIFPENPTDLIANALAQQFGDTFEEAWITNDFEGNGSFLHLRFSREVTVVGGYNYYSWPTYFLSRVAGYLHLNNLLSDFDAVGIILLETIDDQSGTAFVTPMVKHLEYRLVFEPGILHQWDNNFWANPEEGNYLIDDQWHEVAHYFSVEEHPNGFTSSDLY